ncbi:MAG TPA: hypothetical protein VFB38_26505 [Chthonomonadaceae bacterium]|nr:hypothetical protein [Chthonomonadaceae bacterium]
MRSTTRIGLACLGVAALLLASFGAASAQRGQGRRGGMMGMMGRGGAFMLLRNKSVQDELKLTPQQIEKLDAKQQELRQAMRDQFQNPSNDPEERRSRMTRIQEMQQKAIADILDSKQLTRFKQIELQQEGPAALTRKDVADQLNLTDEQRNQVRNIQEDAQARMQEMMQGVDFRNMSPEDRQQLMQKFQAARKEFNDKYLAVLTEAQKEQWNKMLGEPFHLVQPARPNRGANRGGPSAAVPQRQAPVV